MSEAGFKEERLGQSPRGLHITEIKAIGFIEKFAFQKSSNT
jgi:hypothetical protein